LEESESHRIPLRSEILARTAVHRSGSIGMDDGSTSAYSLPMGRPLRLRIISLAAAYAVALQGLLSAFTPVALALPVGVLCSGQFLDEPTVPASHEPSCTSACVMFGATTVPAPPDVVAGRQRPSATLELFLPLAPLTAAPRGLQTARAPPSVW
jgi:hypothetical protein